MNITDNLRNATEKQISAALGLTADMLHVPVDQLTEIVAVAYIMRHYGEGRVGGSESQGWEGFVADL